MALSPEEFERLRQNLQSQTQGQGLPQENFNTLRTQLGAPQPEPVAALPAQQNFFQRIFERGKERVETGIERFKTGTTQRDSTKFLSEQTPLESSLQVVGQVGGFAGDFVFEGLKSIFRGIGNVTPGFIEEPIKRQLSSGFKKLLASKGGQAGMQALSEGIESYQAFKQKNPRTARNLESVVNIGDLMLLARGTTIGKPLAKVAVRTGESLIASGERGIGSKLDDFVRKLVRPEQTKKVKEAQVGRTTETGIGPFKTSIIAPTPQELSAENAIKKIPGINEKFTNQRNFNVIQEHNVSLARQLETDLIANDFIFNKGELRNVLNEAKENLARNPAITGDAEKTADKLITEILRRVDASTAKGSSLLQVRKEFDQWVKQQKGSNIFDPNKENAFSIANREIRTSINNFLDSKSTNVAVKESLAEQSALFTGLNNVAFKAAIEADTAFLRSLDKIGKVLGTKNRIVQGAAAAVGIGGLGAASKFALPAVIAGGLGLLVWRGGKLILNPKIRKVVGQVIREAEKIEARQGAAGLNADLIILKELLEQSQ